MLFCVERWLAMMVLAAVAACSAESDPVLSSITLADQRSENSCNTRFIKDPMVLTEFVRLPDGSVTKKFRKLDNDGFKALTGKSLQLRYNIDAQLKKDIEAKLGDANDHKQAALAVSKYATRDFRPNMDDRLLLGAVLSDPFWFSGKYKQQINEGLRAPIYFAAVPALGDGSLGVFANTNFQAGDFIGLYTGRVTRLEPFDTKNYKEDSRYITIVPIMALRRWYQLAKFAWQFVVDASEKGNEIVFINHSNEANIVMISIYDVTSRMQYEGFFAARAIKENEQLLVDYGPNYAWRDAEGKPINAISLNPFEDPLPIQMTR